MRVSFIKVLYTLPLMILFLLFFSYFVIISHGVGLDKVIVGHFFLIKGEGGRYEDIYA